MSGSPVSATDARLAYVAPQEPTSALLLPEWARSGYESDQRHGLPVAPGDTGANTLTYWQVDTSNTAAVSFNPITVTTALYVDAQGAKGVSRNKGFISEQPKAW